LAAHRSSSAADEDSAAALRFGRLARSTARVDLLKKEWRSNKRLNMNRSTYSNNKQRHSILYSFLYPMTANKSRYALTMHIKPMQAQLAL
jgi:hypothetical protein